MKQIVLFICACIMFTGCNQTKVVNARAEEEAIRKIEDQWTEANKVKDNDKILSFIAPGAVIMNANTPACHGLQAIRKSQESWFADTAILHNTFTSSIDTIEIATSGDLAYARGIYRIKTGARNNPVEDVGKWVTVYRKTNAEWKAIVDIWNSDLSSAGEKLK